MYLSQLQLHPAHRDTWRWLGDCHLLHRIIMSAFPQAPDPGRAREHFSVLYRVEPIAPGQPVRITIQSAAPPDLARIESRAVARIAPPKSLQPLLDLVQPGAAFRFRLRANPSRRVHQRAAQGPDERPAPAGGPRRPWQERQDAVGKRVPLTREEDRIAWLQRRGADHDGFQLLAVRIPQDHGTPPDVRADPGGELRGWKRREDTAHHLTLGAALFEGRLRVTSREPFLAALRDGIGPGKAFGLGLLSIAPLPAE